MTGLMVTKEVLSINSILKKVHFGVKNFIFDFIIQKLDCDL